jgi:hypothetical protein
MSTCQICTATSVSVDFCDVHGILRVVGCRYYQKTVKRYVKPGGPHEDRAENPAQMLRYPTRYGTRILPRAAFGESLTLLCARYLRPSAV